MTPKPLCPDSHGLSSSGPPSNPGSRIDYIWDSSSGLRNKKINKSSEFEKYGKSMIYAAFSPTSGRLRSSGNQQPSWHRAVDPIIFRRQHTIGQTLGYGTRFGRQGHDQVCGDFDFKAQEDHNADGEFDENVRDFCDFRHFCDFRDFFVIFVIYL
jgi:hypothetical protein